jgi:hypothetical protein
MSENEESGVGGENNGLAAAAAAMRKRKLMKMAWRHRNGGGGMAAYRRGGEINGNQRSAGEMAAGYRNGWRKKMAESGELNQ